MNEGGCLRGDEKVHQKGYNIILSLVKPEGDEEWKRERVRERETFLLGNLYFIQKEILNYNSKVYTGEVQELRL